MKHINETPLNVPLSNLLIRTSFVESEFGNPGFDIKYSDTGSLPKADALDSLTVLLKSMVYISTPASFSSLEGFDTSSSNIPVKRTTRTCGTPLIPFALKRDLRASSPLPNVQSPFGCKYADLIVLRLVEDVVKSWTTLAPLDTEIIAMRVFRRVSGKE